MLAPLQAFERAVMLPPCASTRPRAIASPRPPPPVVRAAGRRARSGRTSASALGIDALAGVLDRDLTALASRADDDRDRAVGRRVADRVREQVESTRWTWSGRNGRLLRASRCSRLTFRARFGLEAAQRRSRRRLRAGRLWISCVRAPASIRASSKRSSTSPPRRRAWSRGRAGTPRAWRGRPRSPRSSPASTRAACAGRGSPRRRARGARRTAARSVRPSR